MKFWKTTGLLLLCSVNGIACQHAKEIQRLRKELGYYQRAVAIAAMLHKEQSSVQVEVVVATLKEIDRDLPKYFPNGPFKSEDFISLAMTESRFNPRCVGTSGERGIFQIMPYYKHTGDLASVRTNTELAFKIMAAKYRQHPDYRKAVIAYNGYIIRDGKLLDRYWQAFNRQKVRVCLALNIRRPQVVDKNTAVARALESDVFGRG